MPRPTGGVSLAPGKNVRGRRLNRKISDRSPLSHLSGALLTAHRFNNRVFPARHYRDVAPLGLGISRMWVAVGKRRARTAPPLEC